MEWLIPYKIDGQAPPPGAVVPKLAPSTPRFVSGLRARLALLASVWRCRLVPR